MVVAVMPDVSSVAASLPSSGLQIGLDWTYVDNTTLEPFSHQRGIAMDRLRIVGVALLGGLSSAIEPWLSPDIRRRLKPADGDAVSGALILARRRGVV
jgi:hypothetical protein